MKWVPHFTGQAFNGARREKGGEESGGQVLKAKREYRMHNMEYRMSKGRIGYFELLSMLFCSLSVESREVNLLSSKFPVRYSIFYFKDSYSNP
jgi:hypothetical protein